jgi:hypothetical protein
VRITELRVGVNRTISLGKYEFIRLDAGLTVEIAEGDDLVAVRAALQPELRAILEDTYRAQMKPREKTGPNDGEA